MATILNMRFGFATNSSSTHSIVIIPNHGLSDNRDDYLSPEYYGWEYFTLVSKQEKLKYLGQILKIQFGIDEVTNNPKLTSIGIRNPQEDGGIDHQSDWHLPLNWDGEVNYQFVEDFAAFISRDDVVILGGNDNGEPHPNERLATYLFDRQSLRHGRARKEAPGVWTIFDENFGTKVTVAFGDHQPLGRLASPQLIDVKITDYCDYGCRFCYQNSTAKGAHANVADIERLAAECERASVFEVALGGGEPTKHPFIDHIIKTFRRHGVVPNITTRNFQWVKSHTSDITPSSNRLYQDIRGIGISVKNSAEVSTLEKCESFDNRQIHLVLGAVDFDESKAILEAAAEIKVPVTILGFKHIGRGTDYQSHDIDLIALLKSVSHLPVIGLDTMLVKKYWDTLRQIIPNFLAYKTEGTHSMYIDLVDKKYGASSYTDKMQSSHRFGKVKSLYEMWNNLP